MDNLKLYRNNRGEIATFVAVGAFILLSVATLIGTVVTQNKDTAITANTQASENGCYIGKACDVPACNGTLGGDPANCPACNGGWCAGGFCANCGSGGSEDKGSGNGRTCPTAPKDVYTCKQSSCGGNTPEAYSEYTCGQGNSNPCCGPAKESEQTGNPACPREDIPDCGEGNAENGEVCSCSSTDPNDPFTGRQVCEQNGWSICYKYVNEDDVPPSDTEDEEEEQETVQPTARPTQTTSGGGGSTGGGGTQPTSPPRPTESTSIPTSIPDATETPKPTQPTTCAYNDSCNSGADFCTYRGEEGYCEGKYCCPKSDSGKNEDNDDEADNSCNLHVVLKDPKTKEPVKNAKIVIDGTSTVSLGDSYVYKSTKLYKEGDRVLLKVTKKNEAGDKDLYYYMGEKSIKITSRLASGNLCKLEPYLTKNDETNTEKNDTGNNDTENNDEENNYPPILGTFKLLINDLSGKYKVNIKSLYATGLDNHTSNKNLYIVNRVFSSAEHYENDQILSTWCFSEDKSKLDTTIYVQPRLVVYKQKSGISGGWDKVGERLYPAQSYKCNGHFTLVFTPTDDTVKKQ